VEVPRFGGDCAEVRPRGQSSRSFRGRLIRIVRREIRSRSSPPAIRPHDRGIDEMVRVQSGERSAAGWRHTWPILALVMFSERPEL
jgi:hypothetical protein